MAIVATATLDTGGTFVRLRATGGAAPYTWRGFPTGGTPWDVRGTAGEGADTFDGAAPLGSTITYQVRDATAATADTAAVAIPDPGGAVLSDALDPTRYVVCDLLDQLPSTWEARSVWFDVIDRADPFVALAPMRLRAGALLIRRIGTDDRQSLLDLLRPGTPLRLRANVHTAADDVVLLASAVRESLIVDDAKSGARLFTIDYQGVTGELGPYVADPTWTWADVAADPRTPAWDQVTIEYASWSDLVSARRQQ